MSNQNLSQEEHVRRLRWQCRRGIKEVEVLLLPFFEERYPELSADDKLLFEKLLDQHDVEMFEWFTHRSRPEQPDLAHIVAMVLNRVGA
ncbi:MAG: succinate dehydrogenase assembly factor 2 [Ketobacter sp.]|nr:succinate dehydrogenase assembly factor 2 [Ketobacter sp.]